MNAIDDGLPVRYADEEEEAEETFDPEPEQEELPDVLELAEDIRPAARRGSFTPTNGVLSALIGTARRSKPGEVPPVMCLHESATPPAPYVCGACGVECVYAADPITDPDAPRSVRFMRRALCTCEKTARMISEQRIAREQAEARKKAVVSALARARLALKIPARLARCTFDNYDGDRDKTMKAAFIEVRAFTEEAARFFASRRGTADTLPADLSQAGAPEFPPTGCFLLGPTGRGKTHLCAASARMLAAYGVMVAWENVEQFLTDLRPGSDNAGADRMRAAENADVLFLDDLGTEHISAANPSWGRSIIYGIVNRRIDRDLPTVVSTMVPPDTLAAQYGLHGPAILSRLTAGAFLRVKGPDGRSYGRTIETPK